MVVKWRNMFFRYCLKGFVFEINASTTSAVFPVGPKRGNPTMTTSTVAAKEKGDPQHYVGGMKNTTI